MRLFFASLVIFLFSNTTFAQLQGGISGAYFMQTIPEWETAVFGNRSNDRLLKSGFAQEIDLKIAGFENYRIQFHLNAGTAFSKTSLESRSFELRQIDLSLSSKIFLLSLEADCDCPTFSRDAGLLEKGFYVEFIAGASSYNAKMRDIYEVNDKGFGLKLGLGLGIEIGINDQITVSPYVRYNHFFNNEWVGLQASIADLDNAEINSGSDISPINQISGGIRLGISLER